MDHKWCQEQINKVYFTCHFSCEMNRNNPHVTFNSIQHTHMKSEMRIYINWNGHRTFNSHETVYLRPDVTDKIHLV